ncbi:hypothetical protein [Methanobrevibacter oralis]|uniref:hypothetical protein n=1 Tax=Methanobrevibacter oralis TaxID=66851 RepID=UPI000694E03A|nr:hypothetical protein [Methanobrevibacter oralis]
MQKKATLKKYIIIGVDTRIMQQKEAQKYDTQLAIQSIKQLKTYKPQYILKNRAYDTKTIKNA